MAADNVVVVSNGGVTADKVAYIGLSGLAEEEKPARVLFSLDQDDLTRSKAKKIVEKNNDLRDGQFIELFVSPEKNVFKKLGKTEKERDDNFKAAIRKGFGKIFKELGAENIEFVAGIHKNTNNVHAHVLINTLDLNREKGEVNYIKLDKNNFYRQNGKNSYYGQIFSEAFDEFIGAQPPEHQPLMLDALNEKLPATENQKSERWNNVITSFQNRHKINDGHLGSLIDNGTLYVNRQGGTTFVRRDEKGVVTGYTNENGWTGKNDKNGYFYIGNPQTANRFIITENPKEAIALWELSSHRDLSNVCIVTADNNKVPEGFARDLKSISDKKALRVVWALGLDSSGNQENTHLKEFSDSLTKDRSNSKPALEIVAFEPKAAYGKSWHKQLMWNNAPGILTGVSKTIAETESIQEITSTAKARINEEKEFEKLDQNKLFDRVTSRFENGEFVVYERLDETVLGNEYGRYKETIGEDNLPRFVPTSILNEPANTQRELLREIDVISFIEDEYHNASELAATTELNQEFEAQAAAENNENIVEELLAENTKEIEVSATQVIGANKRTNYRSLTDLVEQVRDIPLEEITSRFGLYFRESESVWIDGEGANKNYKIYENKRDRGLWTDRLLGKYGGRGAIDLVIHLQGGNLKNVTSEDFISARNFLLDNYHPNWREEIKKAAEGKNDGITQSDKKSKFYLPPRQEDKINEVTTYLADRGITNQLLTYNLITKNIYANNFSSAVFVHRSVKGEITGASWRATNGHLRNDQRGSDLENGWFHIGDLESARTYVITDDPVEALSYASMPDKMKGDNVVVIALGYGNKMLPAKLIEHIGRRAGATLKIALTDQKRHTKLYNELIKELGDYSYSLGFKKDEVSGESYPFGFMKVQRELPAGADWNDTLQSDVYALKLNVEQEHFAEISDSLEDQSNDAEEVQLLEAAAEVSEPITLETAALEAAQQEYEIASPDSNNFEILSQTIEKFPQYKQELIEFAGSREIYAFRDDADSIAGSDIENSLLQEAFDNIENTLKEKFPEPTNKKGQKAVEIYLTETLIPRILNNRRDYVNFVVSSGIISDKNLLDNDAQLKAGFDRYNNKLDAEMGRLQRVLGRMNSVEMDRLIARLEKDGFEATSDSDNLKTHVVGFVRDQTFKIISELDEHQDALTEAEENNSLDALSDHPWELIVENNGRNEKIFIDKSFSDSELDLIVDSIEKGYFADYSKPRDLRQSTKETAKNALKDQNGVFWMTKDHFIELEKVVEQYRKLIVERDAKSIKTFKTNLEGLLRKENELYQVDFSEEFSEFSPSYEVGSLAGDDKYIIFSPEDVSGVWEVAVENFIEATTDSPADAQLDENSFYRGTMRECLSHIAETDREIEKSAALIAEMESQLESSTGNYPELADTLNEIKEESSRDEQRMLNLIDRLDDHFEENGYLDYELDFIKTAKDGFSDNTVVVNFADQLGDGQKLVAAISPALDDDKFIFWEINHIPMALKPEFKATTGLSFENLTGLIKEAGEKIQERLEKEKNEKSILPADLKKSEPTKFEEITNEVRSGFYNESKEYTRLFVEGKIVLVISDDKIFGEEPVAGENNAVGNLVIETAEKNRFRINYHTTSSGLSPMNALASAAARGDFQNGDVIRVDGWVTNSEKEKLPVVIIPLTVIHTPSDLENQIEAAEEKVSLTPGERLNAFLQELNREYPSLKLKAGYIGNDTPEGDYRSHYIYSNIETTGMWAKTNAQFGGYSTIEKLAEVVTETNGFKEWLAKRDSANTLNMDVVGDDLAKFAASHYGNHPNLPEINVKELLPELDHSAYETATSQDRNFDPSDQNNYSPEEVRLEYVGDTFALAASIINIEDKLSEPAETKKAQKEHKKLAEELKNNKSDLAHHIEQSGFYFGKKTEEFVKDALLKNWALEFDDDYRLINDAQSNQKTESKKTVYGDLIVADNLDYLRNEADHYRETTFSGVIKNIETKIHHGNKQIRIIVESEKISYRIPLGASNPKVKGGKGMDDLLLAIKGKSVKTGDELDFEGFILKSAYEKNKAGTRHFPVPTEAISVSHYGKENTLENTETKKDGLNISADTVGNGDDQNIRTDENGVRAKDAAGIGTAETAKELDTSGVNESERGNTGLLQRTGEGERVDELSFSESKGSDANGDQRNTESNPEKRDTNADRNDSAAAGEQSGLDGNDDIGNNRESERPVKSNTENDSRVAENIEPAAKPADFAKPVYASGESFISEHGTMTIKSVSSDGKVTFEVQVHPDAAPIETTKDAKKFENFYSVILKSDDGEETEAAPKKRVRAENSVNMLLPETIELSASEVKIYDANRNNFDEIGYGTKKLDGDIIAVISIPENETQEEAVGNFKFLIENPEVIKEYFEDRKKSEDIFNLKGEFSEADKARAEQNFSYKKFRLAVQEKIIRTDLQSNPNTFYLFGDNLQQTGVGGQAQEMRYENNAIGIPTKIKPSNEKDAFFSDTEYDANCEAIDEAFDKLFDLPEGTNIILPSAGLGTGLASLEEKAPRTFEYLNVTLADLGFEKTDDNIYKVSAGILKAKGVKKLNQEETENTLPLANANEISETPATDDSEDFVTVGEETFRVIPEEVGTLPDKNNSKFQSALLPQKILSKIPRRQKVDNVDDYTVYTKFFHPASDWTWFVTEAEIVSEGFGGKRDVYLYGYTKGFEGEWGTFSLNELESINVRGLKIERDFYFVPKTFKEAFSDFRRERGYGSEEVVEVTTVPKENKDHPANVIKNFAAETLEGEKAKTKVLDEFIEKHPDVKNQLIEFAEQTAVADYDNDKKDTGAKILTEILEKSELGTPAVKIGEDAPTLRTAVNALLGVCDGAVTYDGAGFNGVDANFGRYLGNKKEWHQKDAQQAHKMLRKYGKQLLGFGIEYDLLSEDIKSYPSVEELDRSRALKDVESRRITSGDAGTVRIYFNYDKNIVESVKKLGKGGFKNLGNEKYWQIEVTDENRNTIADFANVFEFTIEENAGDYFGNLVDRIIESSDKPEQVQPDRAESENQIAEFTNFVEKFYPVKMSFDTFESASNPEFNVLLLKTDIQIKRKNDAEQAIFVKTGNPQILLDAIIKTDEFDEWLREVSENRANNSQEINDFLDTVAARNAIPGKEFSALSAIKAASQANIKNREKNLIEFKETNFDAEILGRGYDVAFDSAKVGSYLTEEPENADYLIYGIEPNGTIHSITKNEKLDDEFFDSYRITKRTSEEVLVKETIHTVESKTEGEDVIRAMSNYDEFLGGRTYAADPQNPESKWIVSCFNDPTDNTEILTFDGQDGTLLKFVNDKYLRAFENSQNDKIDDLINRAQKAVEDSVDEEIVWETTITAGSENEAENYAKLIADEKGFLGAQILPPTEKNGRWKTQVYFDETTDTIGKVPIREDKATSSRTISRKYLETLPIKAAFADKPERELTQTGSNESSDVERLKLENRSDNGSAEDRGFSGIPDNFVFTDLSVHKGGEKQKFKQNYEAISVLKTLEKEERFATPEEMEKLSKFVGWGTIKEPFRHSVSPEWQKEKQQLLNLIGEEDFRLAQKVTDNAHHTSITMCREIWKVIEKTGFAGGRIIEPAVGSGNFLGTASESVTRNSKLYGCDVDPSSLKIATALYPRAELVNEPFEKTTWKDGSFDLTLTNVPFGNYHVPDLRYKSLNPTVHNYFILKSLDQTRPGGLVAVLTSRFTMDSEDSRIREAMASRAELVGAVRLHNEAFKENAGTEVVTDLLIFKKREHSLAIPLDKKSNPLPPVLPEGELNWIGTVTIDNPDVNMQETAYISPRTFTVNELYQNEPERVLGKITGKGRMYGRGELTVENDGSFEKKWNAFVESIQSDLYTPLGAAKNEEIRAKLEAKDWIKEGYKVGNYLIENAKVYQIEASGERTEMAYSDVDRVKLGKLLDMKDIVTAIYRSEVEGSGQAMEEAETLRLELGRKYGEFRKDYGAIKSKTNKSLMKGDPDGYRILNLEKSYSEKTGKAEKADIFYRATISPVRYVEKADNLSDAIAASLNKTAKLDLGYMSAMLGISPDDVVAKLIEENLAFEDAETSQWITIDRYLSGNVKNKLAVAREKASQSVELETKLARNISALEKVLPEDIPYVDIEVNPGSSLLTKEDMLDFVHHLTKATEQEVIMEYAPKIGRWACGWRSTQAARRFKTSEQSREVWGTKDRDVLAILEGILQGKSLTVVRRETDNNGNTVTWTDAEASAAVEQKMSDIKNEFKEWIWLNDDRRSRIHREYNDKRNNTVAWKPNGSHLKLVGLNPDITPYKHQVDFTWRHLLESSAFAAHEVGTGKTLSMGIAAMEKKRLGQVNKPMLLCLKANIAQVTQQIREAYPHANIFSLEEHYDQNARQDAATIVANNDFDLVIMTYNQVSKLPVSRETQETYLRGELSLLTETISEAIESEGKRSRLAGQLKRRQKNLEAKIENLLLAERDSAITFEETGIDHIMVDEGHNFKSLPVYTTLQNLKGVPTTRSDRAVDLHIRCEYLRKKFGEPRITPATGTPLTNTVAEVHNWMRFCAPQILEEQGLESFDAFQREFTEVVRKLEPTATGTYKIQNRLAKFINVPEMRAMMGNFFDVVSADEAGIKRPASKTFAVSIPISREQLEFRDELQVRAANLGQVDPREDNYFKISIDGEKMSMDMRLVDPVAPDTKSCKANICAINALRMTKEMPGTVQLIFSNIGIHPSPLTGFSLFDEIEQKLIAAGVPKDRIANVSKLSKEKAREAIARAADGDVLFLFGSTERLGTGVNVQKFVYGLHNLDATWLPSSQEQRIGRGKRQGNLLADTDRAVMIFNYLTTGGFDEIKYQANDRKDKFIKQILNNNIQSRTFQDRADDGYSPAEIAAIASGNDDVRLQVELTMEVTELERREKLYRQSQLKMKDNLPYLQSQLEGLRNVLDNFNTDEEFYKKGKIQRDARLEELGAQARDAIAKVDEEIKLIKNAENKTLELKVLQDQRETYVKVRDSNFLITLDGEEYTDRDIAERKLYSLIATAPNSVKLGEFCGFDLIFEKTKGYSNYSLFSSRVLLKNPKSGMPYEVDEDTSGHYLSHIAQNSGLSSLGRRIEAQTVRVRERQDEIIQIENKLGKPFREKEELTAKKAELKEVEGRIKEFNKDLQRERELAGVLEVNEIGNPKSEEAEEILKGLLEIIETEPTFEIPEFVSRAFTEAKIRGVSVAEVEEMYEVNSARGSVESSIDDEDFAMEEDLDIGEEPTQTALFDEDETEISSEERNTEIAKPKSESKTLIEETVEQRGLFDGGGAYASTAIIERSFDQKTRNLKKESISRFWYMSGTRTSADGDVLLNEASSEFVRRAYEIAGIGQKGEDFKGYFNEPKAVDQLKLALSLLEKENPDFSESISRLRFAISDAAKQKKAKTVILLKDLQATGHEKFHESSYLAGKGKNLVNRHGLWTELVNHEAMTVAGEKLREFYPHGTEATDVEELANDCAMGEAEKYGLNHDQAKDFLKTFFRSISIENGNLSLAEFKELKNESKQIRDEIYREGAKREYDEGINRIKGRTGRPDRSVGELDRERREYGRNLQQEISEKIESGALAQTEKSVSSDSGLGANIEHSTKLSYGDVIGDNTGRLFGRIIGSFTEKDQEFYRIEQFNNGEERQPTKYELIKDKMRVIPPSEATNKKQLQDKQIDVPENINRNSPVEPTNVNGFRENPAKNNTKNPITEVFEESSEEISPLEKYNQLLGDRIIKDIEIRAAEHNLIEYQKTMANRRQQVEIDGKKKFYSLSFLDSMAWKEARNDNFEKWKSGEIRLNAHKKGISPAEYSAENKYSSFAEAVAKQSDVRAQLTAAHEKKIQELKELVSEKQAGFREINSILSEAGENLTNEELGASKANIEDVIIWRLQDDAVRRGDAEIFNRLEKMHNESGAPRSNYGAGRLMATAEIADITADLEEHRLGEVKGDAVKNHRVTVELNKNSEGEIVVEQWSIKEVEKRQEKTNERVKYLKSKSLNDLLMPVNHLINPMSTVNGKIAWFTKPAETFNAHYNPVEFLKNDSSVQLIRAVRDFAMTNKDLKAAIGEKNHFGKLGEMVKDRVQSEIAGKRREIDALRDTAKAARTAVETERSLRKTIQTKMKSVNAEGAELADADTSLLDMPTAKFTAWESKFMTDAAIEMQDAELTDKMMKAFSKNSQLAEAAGFSKERLLAQAISTKIEADAGLSELVENAEITENGTLKMEFEENNLSAIEGGLKLSETAQSWIDNLLEADSALKPDFTPSEVERMEQIGATAAPESAYAIQQMTVAVEKGLEMQQNISANLSTQPATDSMALPKTEVPAGEIIGSNPLMDSPYNNEGKFDAAKFVQRTDAYNSEFNAQLKDAKEVIQTGEVIPNGFDYADNSDRLADEARLKQDENGKNGLDEPNAVSNENQNGISKDADAVAEVEKKKIAEELTKKESEAAIIDLFA